MNSHVSGEGNQPPPPQKARHAFQVLLSSVFTDTAPVQDSGILSRLASLLSPYDHHGSLRGASRLYTDVCHPDDWGLPLKGTSPEFQICLLLLQALRPEAPKAYPPNPCWYRIGGKAAQHQKQRNGKRSDEGYPLSKQDFRTGAPQPKEQLIINLADLLSGSHPTG